MAKRKKARKAKKAKKPAKKAKKRPAAKPAPKAAPAKPATKHKSDDKTLAIVGLVLNVLILPGLGTIVMGQIRTGVWQIVLFIGSLFVGILLTVTIIGAIVGIPLMILGPIAAWIWALVSSIKTLTR